MNSLSKEQIKEVTDRAKSALIVAVTKTFPFSTVQQAYDAGFRHLGENRIEEARSKITQAREEGMGHSIWHMIGHVQGRKVKDVVGLFDWVDSVDTIHIAKKLDTEAGKLGKKLHILLEVNLSGEKTKYGFDLFNWEKDPKKLEHFHLSIYESMNLGYIVVEGLMTMAPYVKNSEDNRSIFQSMKRLSETIRVQVPGFGGHLSMGTSCDYEVAVDEGATMVRLGEALFGPRQ
jgi:PLP dependent protein